jgi:hypothetical protein
MWSKLEENFSFDFFVWVVILSKIKKIVSNILWAVKFFSLLLTYFFMTKLIFENEKE